MEALLPRRLQADHVGGVHVRRDSLKDAEPEVIGIALSKQDVAAMR